MQNFLKQAWNDHGNAPEQVAARLPEGIQSATSADIVPLAALITHVMGEHLRAWDRGIELLRELGTRGDGGGAIARSIASLQLAGGQRPDLVAFSSSDRARIFAVAASAISSPALFDEALAYGQELAADDPALRALAVTGNNLACALEETKSRSSAQDHFMLAAALAGRKYWEMAGGWMEIERAEYRLCMTYLQLRRPAEALRHARLCLEICRANGAEEAEIRYAVEAVEKAEAAQLAP